MKCRRRPQLESLEGRSLLSGLSASLIASASVSQPGEPVVFTFQETNVSTQPISVDEGPSLDGFEVQQGGKTIWQSNAGIQPMFVTLDTLQPGQSLTLTTTWDGKAQDGSSPGAGTYTILNQMAPQSSTTVKLTETPTVASRSTAIGTDPQPIASPSGPSPVQVPAGSISPGGSEASAAATSSTPIVVSVATNRARYPRGHRVRFDLTLRNEGRSAVTLPINSTESFTLLEGSRTIWRTARIASGVGSAMLQPGQSVEESAVWNGKAHPRGVPIRAGVYTLDASADGYSGSTTFRIA